MDKPNFYRAKLKAYETLIKQKFFSFPIEPRKLKLDSYNIIVISLQEYSRITGISIEQLTLNGSFNDGYTYFKNNTAYIFYNDDIETEGRKLWTISHEIGHIVLEHTTQCEKNEQEANFFASQILAPQCVLKQLIKNGAKVTSDYLSSKFKISKEASDNCISTLSKVIDNEHIITEYDDIIVNLFKPYISSDYSLDSYFDELEDRRKNFY